jgi:hypothetical protein
LNRRLDLFGPCPAEIAVIFASDSAANLSKKLGSTKIHRSSSAVIIRICRVRAGKFAYDPRGWDSKHFS